jgi:hypothetical protein
MDPVLARKMWRTLEPYHGLVYFAAEAREAYAPFGLAGNGGYFASRAAPLGPVPADVVVATFFNFDPGLVHAAIPLAWERGTPEEWSVARVDAIDRALRRVLGDAVAGNELVEAAELARMAAEGCTTPGRPLYAAHRELPWPDDPHLILWHGITLLREFRGDGHVACLLTEALDGCQALVLHAASGEVPAETLQSSRGWSDQAWAAAESALRERGWLDDDAQLTDSGRDARQGIEDRTDRLAVAPWRYLGEQRCDRLRSLVRPFSRAIVESGSFGFGAEG